MRKATAYNESVSEQKFNKLRLALNRIYTKRGGKGETSLVGGQRVETWMSGTPLLARLA